MPLKTVRTLIIEHDVPFEIVGRAWAFSPEAFARLKAVAAAHTKKARSLGLKSSSRKAATASA